MIWSTVGRSLKLRFFLKLILVFSFVHGGTSVLLHAQEAPDHLDDKRTPIALSVSKSTIAEFEVDSIEIKLTADRPVSDRLVVQLMLGGTATKDLDYEIASTSVVLNRGEEEAVTHLVPLRDWIWEGDETIQLEIASFLGNGRIGSPAEAEVTIADDEIQPSEGEPNYRELRQLTDIYTYSYMRITDQTISVAVIVVNHGFVRSEQTSVTLKLADDPSGENVVHSARRIVPELDHLSSPSGDYFWGEFVHIPINGLRPSTTYYGEIYVEPYEGEAFTYNNDGSFGFALNSDKQVRSQCDHETTGLSTGKDPLLSEQWYIESTGQKAFSNNRARSGEDLHMHDTVENGVVGRDIQVAVVDTGLEICHPDLVENIEPGASYNFLTDEATTDFVFGANTLDPFNPDIYGDHGTSVAGLVGATANNAIGIRGVAPGVKLRGFNFLLRGTDSSEFDSLGASSSEPDSTDVDIFNMSYGRTRWQEPDEDIYQLFEFSTSELRDGKGAIYVKSAGNGWRGCDAILHPIHREIGCVSSGIDYKNRLPYLLVVGALDADGKPAPYASSGSNIWISAPAGWWGRNQPALLTTDQIGADRGYHLYGSHGLRPDHQDSNGDYISTFNGTSGAAGIVSGVVALILEEFPNLTWRDVKHVFANTARQAYVSTPRLRVVIGDQIYTLQHEWQLNGAGYAYHNRYGFGAVDVDRAMAFLKDYEPDSLGEFKKTEWLESSDFEPIEIPDGTGAGAVVELTVDSPRNSEMPLAMDMEAFAQSNIEMVHLQLEIEHDNLRHLGVTLISPSGMESVVNPIFNDGLPRDNADSHTLTLASSAFYGESPVGAWRIKVVDAMLEQTGSLDAAKLRFYYGSHP
ncbi:MAG: S8 family serine peptidase [Gammaproteobacteria bacterium]|nr:S8 family serine peptidase [Gammaproteobacteria bacterium]